MIPVFGLKFCTKGNFEQQHMICLIGILGAPRASLVVAFFLFTRKFWEGGRYLRMLLCHSMNAG